MESRQSTGEIEINDFCFDVLIFEFFIYSFSRVDGKMAEDSETIKDILEVKTGAVSVNSNPPQPLPGIYLNIVFDICVH